MSTAVITGATGGIGGAIAERLAQPGRRLVLQGRRAAPLSELAERVRLKGAEAVEVLADLTRPEDIRHVVEAAGEQPLFALINNAGTALVKPLPELGPDEWNESIAINVTAPFLLVQGLFPRLAAGSAVVNILSVAAKRGFPGWSAYCAAKFALEGFSQALREEVRPLSIRVINIYPAATDTALWNAVAGEWTRERMLQPKDVAEAVAYALSTPPRVQVEGIDLGDVAGNL
jgi:NADP-dependent 3-hydroxy acid dehydrogenase YdfG